MTKCFLCKSETDKQEEEPAIRKNNSTGIYEKIYSGLVTCDSCEHRIRLAHDEICIRTGRAVK